MMRKNQAPAGGSVKSGRREYSGDCLNSESSLTYIWFLYQTINTVCVQVFAGRIFRECPSSGDFSNFFAKPQCA